ESKNLIIVIFFFIIVIDAVRQSLREVPPSLILMNMKRDDAAISAWFNISDTNDNNAINDTNGLNVLHSSFGNWNLWFI
ncbi:MAG: hypothetical protein JSV53_10160, partial [candidate division WOR-3 bacterium]